MRLRITEVNLAPKESCIEKPSQIDRIYSCYLSTMSEGKGGLKKDPEDEPLDDPILELKEMFHQFLATSSEIQLRNRTDIGELKDAILEIKKSNLKSPPREDIIDTPLPDRNRGRRSSMFVGMSGLSALSESDSKILDW